MKVWNALLQGQMMQSWQASHAAASLLLPWLGDSEEVRAVVAAADWLRRAAPNIPEARWR